MMKKLRFFILGGLLTGCAQGLVRPTTQAPLKDQVEYARQLGESKLFDQAVQKLQELKNKNPSHPMAIEAKLLIAELLFRQKLYPEAQYEYALFKELHPNHPKLDFVTYRLGICHFYQIPKNSEKDLSLSKYAISTFKELTRKYPKSPYTPKAKTLIKNMRKKLLEKELGIAKFYLKKKKYKSALGRYEKVLKKKKTKEALYGAVISAFQLKQKNKAQKYYKRLLRKYKNSKEVQKVKDELGNIL